MRFLRARIDLLVGRAVRLRTLWRTVFDLDERTMSTVFYLGDTAAGGLRRSDESTSGPGLLAG